MTSRNPAIRSVSPMAEGIWVVYGKGELLYYRVTNGKIESIKSSLTTKALHIAFSKNGVGWLVDTGGRVWSTTDGGKQWTPRGKIGEKEGIVSTSDTLHFAGEKQGWYSTPFQVFRTQDGGNSWQSVYPTSDFSYRTLKAQPLTLSTTSPEGVWLGMTNGKLLVSSNSGGKWTRLELPESADIRSLFCFTLNECWAGTWGAGGLYTTQNAGLNWRQVLDAKTRSGISISSVTFSTPRDGWATGEPFYTRLEDVKKPFGIVLKTVDGGATWQRSEIDLANPRSIEIGENGIVWLVGESEIRYLDGVTWKKLVKFD